jgi:predicted Zn finger-like uncharacterized protein
LKFLCDNCKAKYQIADEKVAGKTVRMKCRKCGHQIEVRAAVTETSVSTSPPSAMGAMGSGSEAPRPVAKSSLATSLSAAKPRAPVGHQPQAPAPSALAGAFQRTVHDARGPEVPLPQQAGGLELSVTDEWYVAINGVPVGPVRISELRRKAASGAVTEDSLCWQEGLEEWRPVRSIPELAAIVREAAQGNRPSLVSPPNEGQNRGSRPPPAPQRPAPPPPRGPEPPRPAGPGSPFEAPRPTAPSRSNVVPLRVAASSNVDEAPPAPIGSPLTGSGAAAAFAPSFAPAPQFTPAPAFAQPAQMQPTPAPPPPAPTPMSDPFAVPPAPGAATASFLPPAPYAPSSPLITVSQPPPQPRRGVPLWFWPILLFTGVFGVSAAVFVFRQQQQPPPPVVIQMQPTATPTATEAKNDVAPPPTSSEAPVPSSTPSAPSTKVATGGPRSNGVAAPQPEKKGGIDLGGLVGGAGGPNVGGGGGPGPAGGGGLDSSSVERVVAQHRTGVKRTCWERGGADQKASVNVTVSATVAPDGSVSGTSSNGDDPVVAKCIESQVKSWRFSAPGSTTTVNIPFKFVRQ